MTTLTTARTVLHCGHRMLGLRRGHTVQQTLMPREIQSMNSDGTCARVGAVDRSNRDVKVAVRTAPFCQSVDIFSGFGGLADGA